MKAAGARRVRLVPFLLVAGGHATKDLAGDGPESWKSAFEREGFEVEVQLQGMGENPPGGGGLRGAHEEGHRGFQAGHVKFSIRRCK